MRSRVTELAYLNRRDTQAAITSYIAIARPITPIKAPSIDSSSSSSSSPAVHPTTPAESQHQSSHGSNIVPSRSHNDRDIDLEGTPRIGCQRVWLPTPSHLMSDFPPVPAMGPESCLAASALVGTTSAAVTGSPVDAMVAAIDALHGVTGLPWWATIALTAVGAEQHYSYCMLPAPNTI